MIQQCQPGESIVKSRAVRRVELCELSRFDYDAIIDMYLTQKRRTSQAIAKLPAGVMISGLVDLILDMEYGPASN